MVFPQQTLAIRYGGIGMALGAIIVAAGVGGYALGVSQSGDTELPSAMLNAMGATQGETIALATGPIDEVEAIFVLDYLTGDLQCWVINGRTGKFNALFKYNVTADLGVEQGKKPDYVMVTGSANFRGGGAANSLGSCVCYVADGNTGAVAAYAVPWTAAARQGAPQQGTLVRLDSGMARLAAIRNAP